ncbi:MAG: hypothetical protein AAB699_02775 [Patescibacteria group bacterium]
MNTKKGVAPIAVIVVVVVIVALGGFLMSKQTKKETPAIESKLPVQAGTPVPGTETPETAAESDANAPKEVTVTYDANGFSRKTVTVKKGDTVIFQNKTGKPASVASAKHPTHLLYPEFDQYKTAERGKDEFRFTFEKVGAWNYHDHLNPTMTGTVIVE